MDFEDENVNINSDINDFQDDQIGADEVVPKEESICDACCARNCGCWTRFSDWCGEKENRFILCMHRIFNNCCGAADSDRCQCCTNNSVWWGAIIAVTLREVGFLFLFYGIYTLGRQASSLFYSSVEDAAFDHADDLVDFEKALGIFDEVDWQQSVLYTDWIYFFIYFYSFFTGVVMTPILFVFILWFGPQHYGFARTWFWVASVMGVITWAFFPVAPPRLTDYGIVDAVEVIGGIDLYSSLANVYAAFPSMHVGWATLMCVTFLKWVKDSGMATWLKFVLAPFCIAYPVLTWIATVVTGYHWIIDGVAGACYVGIAWVITRYLLGPQLEIDYQLKQDKVHQIIAREDGLGSSSHLLGDDEEEDEYFFPDALNHRV